MIKILRRYTNHLGVEVIDYLRPGHSRPGTRVTDGKTDEQLIADKEREDAIIAEAKARAKPIHGDPTKPPKPGSMLFRMMTEAEVSHPEIFKPPYITDEWTEYWRARGEYPLMKRLTHPAPDLVLAQPVR